tara:strand:- start:383 stop:604 length:222 start_codon:yes stop_codon:yes gene_type:complete
MLNPKMGETIHSRALSDFLKLVYDPYMFGLNQKETFKEKVEITMEYIIELRKINYDPYRVNTYNYYQNPSYEE